MNKYMSRKFIVTNLVLLITTFLAYHGKVDSNVALILSAVIASYNIMQGMVDAKSGD